MITYIIANCAQLSKKSSFPKFFFLPLFVIWKVFKLSKNIIRILWTNNGVMGNGNIILYQINVLILVFADNFILIMLLASQGQWKVVEGKWKIDAVGN